MTADALSAAQTRPSGFRRELGWFSLLAMSLGTGIGSGWLLLPAAAAAEAGPRERSFLGSRRPRDAGDRLGLRRARRGMAGRRRGRALSAVSHGSFTGHLAGWAALVSYAIIPPAEAVAVTRYADTFLPSLVAAGHTLTPAGLLVAIGILVLIGLLNFVGIRYLAAFQNWGTCLKYLPIALFVVGVGVFAFIPPISTLMAASRRPAHPASCAARPPRSSPISDSAKRSISALRRATRDATCRSPSR